VCVGNVSCSWCCWNIAKYWWMGSWQ